ncbi:MAG TPA: GH25 family lysozyme [Candidatus Limnocylindrales bacterium]|nr:GH25 family lysozyme [Candidatus Limnocylindrales bacterium]
MPIFGWDGSHYDWDRGPMDLGAAVRDGIVFFTHKATEGGSYVDPQFAYAMARAKNAGMPLIGAYCVNHKGDQTPQVDKFIRVLDSGAPFWRNELFMVQLDCERWSNKDGVYAYEPSLAEIHAWCDLFVQRTGGRLTPIVYAPRWVYGDSLRGLRYPLWASDYGSNPAVPYRQAYPGDGSSRWSAYSGIMPAVLQFGSRTTIGVQSICDANAFRGTLDQLRALIGDDDVSAQEVWAHPISSPTYGVTEPAGEWLKYGRDADAAVKQLAAELAELETPVAEVDIPALVAALTPALVAALRPELEAAAERAVRKVLGGLDETAQ